MAASIGGWIYASGEANKRETRKELRSELQDIESLLAKVTDQTKVYVSETDGMMMAVSEIQALASIQSLLSRVERFVQSNRLSDKCIIAKASLRALGDYYECASGDSLLEARKGEPAAKQLFSLNAAH